MLGKGDRVSLTDDVLETVRVTVEDSDGVTVGESESESDPHKVGDSVAMPLSEDDGVEVAHSDGNREALTLEVPEAVCEPLKLVDSVPLNV